MAAVYTYSEARQSLATILDQAAAEGEVQILRRDGRAFRVQPTEDSASPLDVKGIDLNLTAEEIVDFIHEGRRNFS